RFGGLLVASLIAATTHPVMDWTNNYGVRPLLPWSSRWFYGDLVFIVDPYLWLVLGGPMFLLTSSSKSKTVAWATLATLVTALMVLASRNRDAGAAVKTAVIIWIAGIAVLASLRAMNWQKKL